MADPFIVPHVVQYTVHGTYGSRPVANVLAYDVQPSSVLEPRHTAIDAMAGILINEWTDSVLPLTNSAYSAESVSWIDLNSEDGDIGTRSSSGGTVWPRAGGALNASMPGNVAMLVRKNVSAARGIKKGRMYLVGVDETSTLNPAQNTLMAAVVTSWQTKMNSFLGDTNQVAGGVGSYDSYMVVIHVLTRNPPTKPGRVGSPLTGQGHKVSSLTVDSLLATQRRRLRG
jgi:hypothetical protein